MYAGGVANNMLALVPPKPKLLHRAPAGPGRSWAGGPAHTSPGRRSSGAGRVRLTVDGTNLLCRASIVIAASTAPAAPRRCPVAPFVELTSRCEHADPNTRRMAACSISSPTGVDVACALTYATSSGASPEPRNAAVIAATAPAPLGCGDVTWCASPDVP